MKISRYSSFNGVFYTEGEKIFDKNNRAFLYGDGFFETMHANGMEIQLFNYHWERMMKAFSILKLDIPLEFRNHPEAFKEHIRKLLHKNRFFQGVRIRISFYRDSDGLYTPKTNKTAYFITVTRLQNNKYQLNSLGLKIGIFNELPHPKLPWSGFKTLNSLVFINAANAIKEANLDDGLFVDNKGNIIEALSSNIFILKDNIISTPPLKSGCVDGVMRKQIINLSSRLKLTALEKNITHHDLEKADEVWLTNAIWGVHWVLSYKSRRYFNFVAKKMTDLLNKELILP